MDLESQKTGVIDAVVARAHGRLGESHRAMVEAFLARYYAGVAPTDLLERGVVDLYGAALAHWQLAQKRGPGSTLVRVYTPDFDVNGWQSTHAAVAVVTDDMPFLVDSLIMELNRHGHAVHLVVHPVITVVRDSAGHLVRLGDDRPGEAAVSEAFIHVEVDRQTDAQVLEELRHNILRVLDDVRAAVEDWPKMRQRALQIAADLGRDPPPVDPNEVVEARALLQWMCESRFVFLGYQEYDLVNEGDGKAIHAVQGSGLGIVRHVGPNEAVSLAKIPPDVRRAALEPNLLILTKANALATVHRPAHLDYVGVKRFDVRGRLVGERRFLGLYTSAIERAAPQEIPVLRRKVQAVIEGAGFTPASHDERALIDVLETYPRDELFQASEDVLRATAVGILQLAGRKQVRLFVRRETFGRFYSCLVFVPRDRYTTSVRQRMQGVLLDALHGTTIEYTAQVGESLHARLHFVVYTEAPQPPEFDLDAVEARLAETTRSWPDDLADAVLESAGEEEGVRLLQRYGEAFPGAYRDDFPARAAVVDLKRIEALGPDADLAIGLYHPPEAAGGSLRFKILRWGSPISLSEAIPALENMGVRVVDERPYEVRPRDGVSVWICDLGLSAGDVSVDLQQMRGRFEDAFTRIWAGEVENDGFNRLVLGAGLTWREASVFRAYGRYLGQVAGPFSQALMQDTLAAHPDIARLLMNLFIARFDPNAAPELRSDPIELAAEVEAALDGVPGLDDDRVLRQFLHAIVATLRTNYFQGRPYLSFKLDPGRVPDLPLPRPTFEIFVYSPTVEGVHLRGGRVARGGIRWSDRRADFRTEVLGLMKAQTVKNAVIVPTGAKGGFVIQRPPADPEALAAEVVAGYRTFVRGLLDLTDNRVDGAVVGPRLVLRYDDDDPYLVVAADKGTATFSDIANGIAAEYGYWLGDAFASGGSTGYDHKSMGITARGAWESVKRHFRDLGVDIADTDFTVVGIGDMSGDVFGNGMLLSPHIKLVAAFDHRHIFLDPQPDPARSHEERQRLFRLARSSWEDYDPALISEGGGVFRRTAKSIPLSPPVRQLVGLDTPALTPTELIRAILRAPVDLLWNGGIGTYVKARQERNADVGDKTNDAVRVDALELRSKVVAEGGNLGFTHAARVEYALNGGRVNTDAIDNSAGVDCSDHEVNLKILLDRLVVRGDVTQEQRNILLADMTEEVARLVLRDNYVQNLALGTVRAHSALLFDVHSRYLRFLELHGKLDREVESMPNEDELAERRAAGLGFTGPELAVLMAHSKITLYEELLASDLPDDPYFVNALEHYFPTPLRQHFCDAVHTHPLRREIVASCLANDVVNRGSPTFVFVLHEQSGAAAPDIVRAYAAAVEVLGMTPFWVDIEALDDHVATETQAAVVLAAIRLLVHAVEWLLHNRPAPLDIAATTALFSPASAVIAERLPRLLRGSVQLGVEEAAARLVSDGVPSPLAHKVAALWAMPCIFDLTEVAAATGCTAQDLAELYFDLGDRLELDWLRARINELPIDDRWKLLGQVALRDDLSSLQAMLAADAFARDGVDSWLANNRGDVDRFLQILRDIGSSGSFDPINLSVAVRGLHNLTRSKVSP